MNCRDAWELLVLEADGALEHDELRTLDAHVASCPACQTERTRTGTEWLAVRRAGRSFLTPETGLRAPAEATRLEGPTSPRLNGAGLNGHAGANGHARLNGHAPRIARITSLDDAAALPRVRMASSPRKRRVFAALIAASVLLGGVYAANRFSRSPAPVSLESTRPALVALAGRVMNATGSQLAEGSPLRSGETYSVASATSTVRFARGDEITLAGEGRVRFESQAVEVVSGAFHLVMGGGVLLRLPGSTVRTGDGQAEVEVSFGRTSKSGPAAEVVVLSGHVEVQPSMGPPVRLSAHERYSSGDEGNPDPGSGDEQNVKGSEPKPQEQHLTPSHEQINSPSQNLDGGGTFNLNLRALLVTVRDARTGLPVPGAVLHALAEQGLSAELGRHVSGVHVPSQREAVSDTDGLATLWGLEPGAYELTAIGPWSYGGRAAELVEVTEGTTLAELVLDPGIVVNGRLLDLSGRPLPGYEVDGQRTDESGRFALTLEPGAWKEITIVGPAGRKSSARIRADWSSVATDEHAGSMTDLETSDSRLALDGSVGFEVEIGTGLAERPSGADANHEIARIGRGAVRFGRRE